MCFQNHGNDFERKSLQHLHLAQRKYLYMSARQLSAQRLDTYGSIALRASEVRIPARGPYRIPSLFSLSRISRPIRCIKAKMPKYIYKNLNQRAIYVVQKIEMQSVELFLNYYNILYIEHIYTKYIVFFVYFIDHVRV